MSATLLADWRHVWASEISSASGDRGTRRATGFAVAPHFRSPGHPETAFIDDMVEWYLEHRIAFVALRDGDVIVQEGDALRVLPGTRA